MHSESHIFVTYDHMLTDPKYVYDFDHIGIVGLILILVYFRSFQLTIYFLDLTKLIKVYFMSFDIF